MNEPMASGPDTHKQPSRSERLLENGLSDAADGIADLMAQARAVDPAADEFGHARSRCYTDAVALLKACAKVGHTVAELRGSKFEHNINVRRQNAGASSANIEDDDAYDTNWMWLDKKEEILYNWKNKRRYKLEKPATDAPAAITGQAVPDAVIDRNGETPLVISEGSNGNFESSAAGDAETGSA